MENNESQATPQAQEARDNEGLLNEMKAIIQDKDREIDGLKNAVAAGHEQVKALNHRLESTMAAYRQAVISSNPDLPDELIGGNSIEEIEQSVAKARNIAERIRKEIEAAAARHSIPAGTPVRHEENPAGFSSRDKIQYALGGKQ